MKKAKNKRLPALRFPEFKGDGEWEEKRLGEVAEMKAGKYVKASEIYTKFVDGLYPCYGGNGLRGYTKSYTHLGKYSLIGRQGALCGNVTFVQGKFHATEHAVVVSVERNIDAICFFYILDKLNLNQYATGLAQPGLSVNNLEEIKIMIPKSKAEQQKIASFLSGLDELIAAHRQKLELLKRHKKGLLQQLFPQEGERVPRLRFPEFKGDGEWEEKRLGEVGEFVGGGTPSTNKSEYWDGHIQWYTPTEVKNGRLKDSIRRISVKGLNNSSAKLLPKGTLLITTRATIGDVGIAREECATNQGFQNLIVNDLNDNIFWFYWILKNRDKLEMRAHGSTFKEISKNEIKDISVLKPSKQEQQKIASCLSSLDELIEAEAEKIEQLERHKKGLMQRVFPVMV